MEARKIQLLKLFSTLFLLMFLLSLPAEALARALEKLAYGVERAPMQANPATEPLYIVNPLTGGGIQNWFSTHPPIEERVARLRAMRSY